MRINDWYVGVVEDVNDPYGQGRVRVRCLGYHTPDRNMLPTQDLPLATVILPATSASVASIGVSSTGLVAGTWVFGFFRDGIELQDPVILGTIASASGYDVGYDVTNNLGFGDAHGALDGFIGNDIPPEAGGAASGSTSVYNSLGAANVPNGMYYNTQSVVTSFDQPTADAVNVSSEAGSKLIAVARSQIGVKETSKNQGPGIEKYWSATAYGPSGYSDRRPWCAAYASWVVLESGILPKEECPNTASAFEFRNWAILKPFAKVQDNPRYIRAGDIIVYTHSHVGFATSDSNASGVFSEISGNSGGSAVKERTSHISRVKCKITLTSQAETTPSIEGFDNSSLGPASDSLLPPLS